MLAWLKNTWAVSLTFLQFLRVKKWAKKPVGLKLREPKLWFFTRKSFLKGRFAKKVSGSKSDSYEAIARF